MAFLNDKKKLILNQIVNNDNITSIQKLYNVVKISYKEEGITKKNCKDFLVEYRSNLVDNQTKIKHNKTVQRIKNNKPKKIYPCPGNYYALDFRNMTDENLLRYCETNNISLDETCNNRSLIIQRIHYIQPSTFKNMPLEGVQWYVKSRNINVTGNETFDDLMVIIQ